MTDNEARALDRQMALALGYTIYHYNKDVAANCYYMLMTPDFDPAVLGWHDGERKTEAEAWMDCPHFSTDIKTAWTVLDGLETRGARWTIERLSDAYCVRILMPPASGPDEYGATMESVQEAICRAAVAAVDITKNHAPDGA